MKKRKEWKIKRIYFECELEGEVLVENICPMANRG